MIYNESNTRIGIEKSIIVESDSSVSDAVCAATVGDESDQ